MNAATAKAAEDEEREENEENEEKDSNDEPNTVEEQFQTLSLGEIRRDG